MAVFASIARADRAFLPRFSANATGNVTLVGNTLMTCPATASACAAARAGTATGTNLNNNTYAMVYVDQDADPTTFNSSSADLTLPADAYVLWAGLYWGGDSGSPTAAGRSTISFRPPGAAAYTSLTAFQTDAALSSASGNADYASFVDVTQIVRTAGAGTYWGANVVSTPNTTDKYAGWSLVVAYRSGSEPARNITVFDGYRTVNSSTGNSNVNVTVSGFLTPPAGPVETGVGVVAFEGDAGMTGDYARLNGTNLSDALNPSTNFFNSTISSGGVRISAKSPDYVNQLGFDVDQVRTTGLIGNSATSATINLGTGGESYYPVALTFATLLYAPQVALTKNAVDLNGGTLRYGDTLEFTVQGDNSQGRDNASNVVITDVLPPGVTYVPGSATVTGGSGTPTVTYDPATRTLTATVGTLAAVTGTVTLRFRATVNSDLLPGATIDNTANVTYNGTVTGTSLGTSSNTVRVEVTVPDLAITKSPDAFTATANGTQGFRLQVRNAGTAPTADGQTVTVTDVLAGTPFDRILAIAAHGWTCTPTAPTATPATISCTRSDGLAPGAAYPPIDVTLHVADVPRIGPVANTATVTSPEDPNIGSNPRGTNNTSTVVGTHVVSADVAITKTPATQTVNVGDTVSFTLRVVNNGPSTARNVTVTDTMPPSLTDITPTPLSPGMSCQATGRTISCNLPDMAHGDEATIRVSGTATVAGSAFNTASAVTSSNDPDTSNNSAQAQFTVNAVADLGITKSVSPTPTVPRGREILYTLTVTNHSAVTTATGVRVYDALPPGFSFTSASPAGACTRDTATNALTCTLADMAPGGTTTITVTGTASTAGTQVNTVSVGGTLADPVPGNNVAEATVTVVETADLAITKAAPAAVDAGSPIAYTLTITNAGPDTARNTVVTDVVPAGVDLTSLTLDSRCALSGRTVTCALGDLSSAASTSIAITGTAVANATVTVSNGASVTSDTLDPNTTNNRASATTTITPVADVSITKTGPASDMDAYLGNTLAYALTVTNAGPSAANGVTVVDDLPARVDLVDVTPSAGTCTNAGRRVTCSIATLAVGDTMTITIRIQPNAPGDISNTATVDPGSATDRNVANNASTHTFTAIRKADLAVTKTRTTTTPVQNQPVSYQVTVTNRGPNDATDVILTDHLPPDFTGVTVPDPACAVAGDVVTCGYGTLAPGASRTFTLTGTPTADTLGINKATVSTSSTDPDPTNDRADAPGFGTPAVADLSITKTGPATLNLGQTGTYTLTVANAAGGSTVPVLVSDQLPAGIGIDPNGTLPTGCAQVAGTTPPLIRCTLTLTGGQTATLAIPVIAISPTGTVANHATIVGSGSRDDNLADNTASATTTIVERANVVVTKSIANATVDQGDAVTYTITVTNTGPDPARRVAISDQLPAAFTPSLLVLTQTTGTDPNASCTNSTSTVTCDLRTIPAGESFTIRASGTATGIGSLDNTVFATTASPDTAPADNTATATGTSRANVDLSIVKTGPTSFALDGAEGVYTLTVANSGTSAAPGTVITDVLPRGLVPGTAAPTVTGIDDATCTVTDGIVTCDLGIVPAGATGIRITIPVRAVTLTTAPTVVASVSNTATISSDIPDRTPADDSSTLTSTVVERGDLALTKTGPTTPVRQYDAVTYTIGLRNDGPNTARHVLVTDVLPQAFTLDAGGVGVTVAAGGPAVPGATASNCTVDATTRRMTCALGDVPNGAAITITLTGTATGVGSLANQASVTSDSFDGTPGDNAAGTSGSSYRASDISITKAASAERVNHGDTLVYTLTATNAGPSDALTTTIVDALPVGVDFVSTDQPAGTCTSEADAGSGLDTVTCTRPELAARASWTVAVTVRVTADAPLGLMRNTAAVQAASNQNPTPFSTPAVTDVLGTADLRVTKLVRDPATGAFVSSGAGTVDDGDPLVYRILVDNAGPDAAEDLVVTDTLPTELADAVVSTSMTGVACPITAGVMRCEVRALPADTQLAITVTGVARLTGATGVTAANTVSVTSPTNDPDAANNSATVTVPIRPVANILVTKTTDSRYHDLGEVGRFRIRVGNHGPSRLAANVVVRDEVPAGLEIVAVPDNCTVAGQLVTCRWATIEMEHPQFVEIQVRGTAIGAYPNVATGTSDATDTAMITNADDAVFLVGRADLTIAKRVASGEVTVGEIATFEITVTNRGPSAARTVRVRDELPVGALEAVDVSPAPACGIVEGNARERNVADCTFTSIPAGGSETVTLRARVLTAGAIQNTAYTYSKLPDPNEADNTSTVALTGVTPPAAPVAPADLVMRKTASRATVRLGDRLHYTLTITNRGGVAATDVRITDPVPRGLRVRSASDGCAVTGAGVVTCGPLTLAPGASASVRIDATAVTSGRWVNRAAVSAAGADANPADNAGTAAVVIRPARLVVRKTPLIRTVRAGGVMRWRITVRNLGPSHARNTTVCDILGRGLTLHSRRTRVELLRGARRLTSRPATLTLRRTTACTRIPVIPAGQTARLVITTRVSGSLRGRVINTATAQVAGQRARVRHVARVQVVAAVRRPPPSVTG